MEDEERLNHDIEKKLSVMEQEDYVFPKRLTRRDYIIIVSVCLICFLFLILGVNV